MATIAWPETLPQTLMMQGYAEAASENVVRDQFDTGPAGLRRRATSAPYKVIGRMQMTTAQWETLRDFCADVLIERMLPFGLPAQGDCDSPTDEWLVRLLSPPTRVPLEDAWEVTLELEVLP